MRPVHDLRPDSTGTLRCALLTALLVMTVSSLVEARSGNHRKTFSASPPTSDCTFSDVGENPYFVLIPGHELQLAGETKEGFHEMTVTVLDETRWIDGVRTRAVEEYETVDGVLVERTLNYFAVCEETNAVYFFGESVDHVESGVVVDHQGSWEAGVNGARPGLQMPAIFLIGSRYQVENAPGSAMDRAEHLAAGFAFKTPAGVFQNCVELRESTPLEPGELTVKVLAEGIGWISDGDLRLIDWTPGDD